MKLRTEKGKWILTDGEREIDFKKCGTAAWGYALIMKDIRKMPKVRYGIYPVKSLVPHPKKGELQKKWRERIKDIKRKYEMGLHEPQTENLCVSCGIIIPEGHQVCQKCERNV